MVRKLDLLTSAGLKFLSEPTQRNVSTQILDDRRVELVREAARLLRRCTDMRPHLFHACAKFIHVI